jgi:hypothetical protein
VATSVIAMTANLLNLLDLRPGRALKAYLLLAAPAAVATAVTSYGVWRSAAETSLAEAGVIPLWALVAGLLLLVVGRTPWVRSRGICWWARSRCRG